jgi:hypothetical protein
MKKYFFLVILDISIVCLFHYVLAAINIHLFILFIYFITGTVDRMSLVSPPPLSPVEMAGPFL